MLSVLTPLACLLLGFYVAAVRAWDLRAWLLLAVLVSFSLVAAGSDTHDKIMLWHTPLRHVALLYRSIGIFGWPVWLMIFAVYFPERAEFDRRHPRLKWLILVPAIVICLAATMVRVAHNESGALYAAIERFAAKINLLRAVSVWLAVIFFLCVLGIKWVAVENPDARRRLRVLFSGLAVSLVPPYVVEAITTNVLHMRLDQLPPWIEVPALSLLALFPVTLAYVTVVQRALDVRVILRQSLQYALARRGVVLLQILVSIIVILAVAVLSGGSTFPQRMVITALGIVAILLVGLGARRLAGWIDRRFFREAYNTEQILNRLADSVSSMVELGPLLDTVTKRMAEALHISKVAVFLREQNRYRPAFALGYGEPPGMLFENHAATVAELRLRNRPLPVYFSDPRSWAATLGNAESSMLQALQTQLLLPIARRSELLGFISLGAKISEAPYSSADTHLLHAVASQTALAVENTRLTSAIASETAEREVLNRELAIAREVQERLFPQSHPEIAGVEYFGTCRPAQQVGGDYYDFLELPGRGLGLAIGDVSGKGVPASLLMATLQASLRGRALSGDGSIDCLMANVNKLVHAASSANRYATFFYAQYEAGARRLTYVNAGHNPPMLLRQNGSGTEVVRLEAGGPPVGLFAEAAYESSLLELRGGDVLVLFTDGISEAMNGADEEWGEDRLLESITKSWEAAPNEMVTAIFRAADEFTLGAPQHDDMTIVTLRVRAESSLS
ncbi:MAG TPA: SpoIIE family protein phosphatase [Bryobacteraceae bacterium]